MEMETELEVAPGLGPAPPPSGEMSDSKVLVRFWPDEYSLMGPPAVILDVEDAAENLADSGFMRPWIAARIRDSLLSGELFKHVRRISPNWKGRPDGVKAEYRMASKEEVINFAETQRYADVTGHPISRRSQEKSYLLHYLDSNRTRETYDELPKQAKAILDVLNESGRENLTEAAIEVILEDKKDQIKTKQSSPMKVFGFYRSRYVEEGHLEVTGD